MTDILKNAVGASFTFKKVRIHISALILVGMFLVGGDARVFAALIFAAIIHEIGHILSIKMFGMEIKEVNITAVGASIQKTGYSSYKRDIAVSAMGPAVSFSAFIISYIIYIGMGAGVQGTFLSVFCGLNLILCILNLIPVLPLDGGVMLFSYLLLKYDISHARKLMFYISLSAAVILFALGCICFYYTKFNISIMLIALFLLFCVSRYEKLM